MILFIGIILTIFMISIAVCCCVVAGYRDEDIEEQHLKEIYDLKKENELLNLMLYEMTMELENEDNSKVHTD